MCLVNNDGFHCFGVKFKQALFVIESLVRCNSTATGVGGLIVFLQYIIVYLHVGLSCSLILRTLFYLDMPIRKETRNLLCRLSGKFDAVYNDQ